MNNRDDENLEKMIFEFCKNDREVPPYVDKAVEDGLERCRNLPVKKSKFSSFKRVAIILICFGLLATGGVFAINYIVSLFTNSTPGIDSAVENGFVHEIDMDFVYDNGIGIKVDSVVMSTTTLDISFVYDCPDYDDVSKINIYDYEITDEEGNLIAKISEPNIDDKSIIINYYNKGINVNNENYYTDSILYTSNEFPDSEILYFSITKILISSDTESYYIEGDWCFAISLNNELISQSESLSISNDNEYVKNVESYLDETTFVVYIELTQNVEYDVINEIGNVILTDYNNTKYDYNTIKVLENSIYIEFSYGKYNIDGELNLYIKFAEDKSFNIKFN